MSSIQITALVIILLYMAATVAIGLIVSRMKQSREAKQSNDDFLMASKSFSPNFSSSPSHLEQLVLWRSTRYFCKNSCFSILRFMIPPL